MINLLRTTSDNPHFRELVRQLDAELRIRDGDDSVFYSQFNSIDTIKHAVVAYEGVDAVGCGALRPYEAGTVEVKRMFVPLDMRGQGIASKILAGLERWAIDLGFKRCILETGHKQPEAIALYTKNGYGTIPNYGQYESVENSVCFEKIIAPKASLR
jgi:GNAT superfamily N-acetyltransferase